MGSSGPRKECGETTDGSRNRGNDSSDFCCCFDVSWQDIAHSKSASAERSLTRIFSESFFCHKNIF